MMLLNTFGQAAGFALRVNRCPRALKSERGQHIFRPALF